MKKTFLIFITLLIYCSIPSYAKIDTTKVDREFNFNPKFYSIQADFTTLVFMVAGSASIDLNFLETFIKTHRSGGIGIRIGAEIVHGGSVGGTWSGSPFISYNLLGRVTFGGSRFRFDTYAGYSYVTSIAKYSVGYPVSGVKFGFEGKWMIVRNICGLLLKISGPFGGSQGIFATGIGVVFGFSQ